MRGGYPLVLVLGGVATCVGGVALLLAAARGFASLVAATHVPPTTSYLVGAGAASLAAGLALCAWIAEAPERGAMRIPVALRGALTRGDGRWLAWLLSLLALLPIGLIVTRLIVIGSVFGPDESAYAILARGLVLGTPLSGWSPHRAPLISFFGMLAVPFGTSEIPYRTLGLVSIVALAATAGWLGRAIAGLAAGVFAILVLSTVPALQQFSSYFLTDVPAAAAILLLVALTWRQFEVRRASGSVLPLALVAAVAFYLRYSSGVAIALIALTTLLLWPRRVVKARARVLTAIGLLVMLLVPFIVFGQVVTGRPWGVVTLAVEYAAPTSPGIGLGTYLRTFPSELAGSAASVVMACAIIGWLGLLLLARRSSLFRAVSLLVIPAVADAAILGITSLPQTRFLFFPISSLIVAGIALLVSAWRRLALPWRTLVAAPAVVAVVALALTSGVSNTVAMAGDAPHERFIRDAGYAIRNDAGASQCSVLTYLNSLETWYSGCASVAFGVPPQAGRQREMTGTHRYLVLFAGRDPSGRGFGSGQPADAMKAAYLRLTEPTPIAVIRDPVSGRVVATVYRLREGVAAP